jgi:diguanylate cyclase (GGDEF)-like protein/PAS domain S-box-containing protein
MDTKSSETSKGNILIVDDTPENLHLLSSTLIEQGYDVRGVVSGVMALRAARLAPPDLILLDIMMPELDGYQVCRQLKASAQTRDIPVIFLSALDNTVDIIKAFTSGGVDYITKPFRVEEVLARVKNQLAIQVAQAEIRQLNLELEQRIQERTEALVRKNAELLESEARFRLIAENMSDLICLHEPDGRYLYLSPSCEALLGFQAHELLGKKTDDLLHPEDRQRLSKSPSIETNESTLEIYRVCKKTGEYIWVETVKKPIVNDSGEIIQIVTSSRDVNARVWAEEQLIYAAMHDTLTGLPNRFLLLEKLDQALQRAKQQPDYIFAILFIDLDRFKLVNDSLGHCVGDQLLVAVARLLEDCLRSTDTVARLGGDEFTLLLDQLQSVADAIHVAERIQERLKFSFNLEGHLVSTTASIGIVLGSPAYHQSLDLLRDADIAMYRAKDAGKARYEIFDSAMHEQALKLLQLETDLRQAIAQNEFVVYYQPIISLTTGQLTGFEALVRWQHPQKGLVYPDEFIPVSEDSGLILPIGRWVLGEACRQLQAWRLQFPSAAHLTVSVNLSSRQIKEPDFVTQLDQILAETGLSGDCLKLEITESMLIENTEAIATVLLQIRERHIQLSLDDFGTGYSSLSYLHRFPVDFLKIDRSFINCMSSEDEKSGIIRAIITLAHTLGMEVIAEGVETAQQLNHLRVLTCEFAQGYLFARPLTCESAEQLIALERQW